MKIYFLRHQAGGVLVEWPFLSEPTPAQQIAVAAEMERLHGKVSRKGQPYWMRVVEYRVYLEDEEPEFAPVAQQDGLGLPMFEIRGTGTVTPPKG